MTPLRVLHAITMLELGGAQRNTLDTCRLLDRSRFVVGLACADRGELFDEARRLGDVALFPLRRLRREVRPLDDLRAFGELRRTIRTFRPDVVHTHSSKAGVLGRLAARRERVAIVVHSIHGFGFGAHQAAPVRWAFVAAERLVAPWTTQFVAVSRRNLEQGVSLGLFPRGRARVIRSGIDRAAFCKPTGGAELRRSLGIPAEAPLIVQVACFKPQKAPERFVELAAAVSRRVPAAHFLLVGDGDLRGRLEALRAAAGLGDRLHLPGWRRDVAAVYAAATVVTLTSRFEGLPRAVVEALTAGVPVAAMAVDGVGEVVRDGVNGFLVAEGDTVGLAARVVELLEDTARRAAFAARAGEALDEFDRDAMVRQQEAMYEELAVSVGLRDRERGPGIGSLGPRSPVPGTLAGAGGGPR